MRKLASIRRIKEIRPIEGADLIELAFVDGWQSIVKKDEFKVGDLVVYFEIDSFLPQKDEYKFLEKSCKKVMNGETGYRLRTIRLRGELSQGLIMPVSILPNDFFVAHRPNEAEGVDVTELLGVVKYEPPIPTQLAGKVSGNFPSFIPKTDAERIQNLKYPPSGVWWVSEKIDGASITVYNNGKVGVCSRNWDLEEDDENAYWRAVRKLDLIPTEGYAIQGELIGPGIQGNKYQKDDLDVYVFSVWNIDEQYYLEKWEFDEFCLEHSFKTVPQLGLWEATTVEEMLKLAEGRSKLAPVEREGLVWRLGGTIFKTISNKFLLNEKD